MIRSIRTHLLSLTIATVGLAASDALRAQAGACDLPELVDRAAVVAVVRPLGSVETDGRVVWTFRVTRTLFGPQLGRFQLSEPLGRACGRALHGLVPNSAHLVFLLDPESPRLVVSGAAAIPSLDPATQTFVDRLLGTRGEDAARLDLLVDQAFDEDSDPALTEQALRALAIAPGLPGLDPRKLARLRGRTLTAPAENPRELPPLIRILERCGGRDDLWTLDRLASDPRAGFVRPWILRSLRAQPQSLVSGLGADLPIGDVTTEGTGTGAATPRPRFRSIRPHAVR